MSDDQRSPYADSHDGRHSDGSYRDDDARDRYGRDEYWNNSEVYGVPPPGELVGWTWFSWFAIASVIVFIIVMRQVEAPNKEVLLPPLDDSPASLQTLQAMNGRLLVGLAEMIRQIPGGNPDQRKALVEGDDPAKKDQHLFENAAGNYGQRLQNVIIVGDISGPDNALRLLGLLNLLLNQEKLTPSAEQLAVQRSLGKIYRDEQQGKFDLPSVKDDERQRLLNRLGWYGKLALTPAEAPDKLAREAVVQGPRQAFVSLIALLGTACGLAVMGLLGYLGFTVSAISGTLKFGLQSKTRAHGVYAETFAIWLIGYTGAMIAIQHSPWPQARWGLSLIAMFGSLIALLWPVFRGIPFSQVRKDLGLTWGRAGILEPCMGIPGYCLTLPMLAVGITLMIGLFLLVLIGQPPNPAPADESAFRAVQLSPHPAILPFLQGDRIVQIQLLVLACIAAPIVEEIMFRGVLYRHLRDATRSWGFVISGLFSALWMGFIFAVIHPQPPIAIPALMAIACGCAFVREWRDSLWASMVVHGINNGMIFTMLLLISR